MIYKNIAWDKGHKKREKTKEKDRWMHLPASPRSQDCFFYPFFSFELLVLPKFICKQWALLTN